FTTETRRPQSSSLWPLCLGGDSYRRRPCFLYCRSSRSFCCRPWPQYCSSSFDSSSLTLDFDGSFFPGLGRSMNLVAGLPDPWYFLLFSSFSSFCVLIRPPWGTPRFSDRSAEERAAFSGLR